MPDKKAPDSMVEYQLSEDGKTLSLEIQSRSQLEYSNLYGVFAEVLYLFAQKRSEADLKSKVPYRESAQDHPRKKRSHEH